MKNSQRRIAADLLKVGQSRVWIDPDSLDEVSKAITRDDIRRLIVKNVIQAKPQTGVSRGRAKELLSQRHKGRRRGPGSKKGTSAARTPEKRTWINKVRALRSLLKDSKNKKLVDNTDYRSLYKKIKGNFFRSKSHLKSYIDKLKKE